MLCLLCMGVFVGLVFLCCFPLVAAALGLGLAVVGFGLGGVEWSVWFPLLFRWAFRLGVTDGGSLFCHGLVALLKAVDQVQAAVRGSHVWFIG
ncbi:hypothetical protein AZ036_004406 [Klebsiella michiganensis]|nr:hypothetical protein AZ036_004406 [Klebsiella michiganensis]